MSLRPVAQTSSTSSLLYRGFPIRQRFEVRRLADWKIGDTAGWKLLETCATFRFA